MNGRLDSFFALTWGGGKIPSIIYPPLTFIIDLRPSVSYDKKRNGADTLLPIFDHPFFVNHKIRCICTLQHRENTESNLSNPPLTFLWFWPLFGLLSTATLFFFHFFASPDAFGCLWGWDCGVSRKKNKLASKKVSRLFKSNFAPIRSEFRKFPRDPAITFDSKLGQ